MVPMNTTSRPGSPVLTSLNSDGPVVLRERGKRGQGLVWTVQPEHHQNLVDFINTHGGPEFWSVEAVN